jgi:hypothetical protein
MVFVSLTFAFRSMFDPNGTTQHSFIGRKQAQECTKEGVDRLLQ